MADFAQILAALDKADTQVGQVPPAPKGSSDACDASPGFPRSDFELYLARIRRLAEEVVEGESLGPVIAGLVEERGAWEGTAAELIAALTNAAGGAVAEVPRAPHILSGRLRRLIPALASTGVAVAFFRIPGGNRVIRLKSIANKSPSPPLSTAC